MTGRSPAGQKLEKFFYMENRNKFIYEPPCMDEIDSKLLICLGNLVPGGTGGPVLDPDEDPDFS